MVHVARHGSWTSPVSAELLAGAAVRVTDVWVDGETTWWSESLPAEGGREQVVRLDPGGTPVDVLPEGFSARTRVHEYGGGAWWVWGSTLFFASWDDQRLHRLDPGSLPVPITPEPPGPHALRYADGVVTPDGRWVVCVRERHPEDGSEAINEVVALLASPGDDGPAQPVVLAGGRDFVAAPRVSRDGRQLAWLTWDHPDMPWDGTQLWVANLVVTPDGLQVQQPRREAGGRDEALMQPVWGRHGHLFVISDRSGWWNVHRVDGVDRLTPLHSVPAEVGGPAWVFGQSDMDVARDGTVVATYPRDGSARLLVVPEVGPAREVPVACLALRQLRVSGGAVTALAIHADRDPEVVRLVLADPDQVHVLRPARDLGLPEGLVGRAEHLSFPSEAGRVSHAWYRPPRNPDFEAPEGDLPPLIVLSHGGPTGAADPGFSLAALYWTSRGFGVVDVDYGGSTGYGRDYRQALNGAWGVVDVDDCVAAARHLVAQGRAAGDGLLIRGGSAGGFTTLAVLATHPEFAGGANMFGVADLEALAADTHKFESRYLDRLIGPLPEARATYRQRSPIHNLDGFASPLIVFQGSEDAVVPPAQSEAIVAALDARGVPNAYLSFEGEQHGFRRAESIIRVAQANLAFFRRILGLPDPEGLPAVDIQHAEALPVIDVPHPEALPVIDVPHPEALPSVDVQRPEGVPDLD